MTHKILTANLILLTMLACDAQGFSQASEVAQSVTTAPSPQQAQKIVTKDPEYMKLLNPPQGNVFLQTYSKSYRDKSAEIEARVAAIDDDNLRNQTRNEEWIAAHQQDGDKFTYEAEVALREAKISFSERHRNGWFEVGRVTYDDNNGVLVVLPNSTTPIDSAPRFPMKVSTLNQIYGKFQEIAGQEIERKAHEYVANAQAGSNCSKFPDLCFKHMKEEMEQGQRAVRLEVVAQGDLESMKIDRLFLVDYVTETILLELNSAGAALGSSSWRFSVGPVPAALKEQASADKQAGTSDGGSSVTSGQSGVQNPSSSTAPANRVSVLANVVAASIITKINPEYPAEARAKNIQGEVVLHATIDKEGNVSQIQVWSGDDALAKSAVEAVRQWKYKPMLVDGAPKEVDTTITLTFSQKE
jgi:periplasmic protein TonB